MTGNYEIMAVEMMRLSKSHHRLDCSIYEAQALQFPPLQISASYTRTASQFSGSSTSDKFDLETLFFSC